MNEPVYAFFFLVSPEENPGQHLRLLAQIASQMDDEMFMRNWHAAKNELEIKELLLRDERFLCSFKRTQKTKSLINKPIRDLQMPEGSLIALIHRNGEILIPKGSTILHDQDRLTMIGNSKGIKELKKIYGHK